MELQPVTGTLTVTQDSDGDGINDDVDSDDDNDGILDARRGCGLTNDTNETTI